ncbi:membrane protein insertion efficiency factor YidD [Roseospirillum parvum]|uniref:Putative membrane protein insertion efficiency factor n=1 Tax=Roseospirillum parvum TaxID=83401 RepID=A0A1G7WQB0_9PROT|nr:membrane protein insertion efficiency factor YidD [Roseospirillum parvum]SDG74147.1 hypothetical protein SAMN05421742_102286 [Roseospirillum parvum]
MGLASRVLRGLVRGYQLFISPLTPPHCRHVPTCSVYADQALRRYGALGGVWLATIRVLRCHPFGTAGYDPVPDDWRPPWRRRRRPGDPAGPSRP